MESSQCLIKRQQTPNRAKLLAGSTGTSTWCNYLMAPMESSERNIKLHSTVNWLQQTFHKLKQTCLLVPVPMDSIHSNTTCWLHWHLHRPSELLSGSNGISTQRSYLLAPLASPQGINYLLVPMESSQSNIKLHSTVYWLQQTFHKAKLLTGSIGIFTEQS